MKAYMYKVVFEATETLQNGKERKIKKGVLVPRFTNGRHTPPELQEARGEQALKEAGYYNIRYIETVKKELIYG